MSEADTISISCPECGTTGTIENYQRSAMDRIACAWCGAVSPFGLWSMAPSSDLFAAMNYADRLTKQRDPIKKMTELSLELEEMAKAQPNTEAAKALKFCARRIREIMQERARENARTSRE